MDQESKKEIEEIIGGLECLKDFRCYEWGFEVLCKAEDIGLKLYLRCLEEQSSQCKFSFVCKDEFYCSSPLHLYISKKLKK